MKTAPTNKKIRELISMVKEGKLIPRPEFQRRLVWTRDDKNHFLNLILRGIHFQKFTSQMAMSISKQAREPSCLSTDCNGLVRSRNISAAIRS